MARFLGGCLFLAAAAQAQTYYWNPNSSLLSGGAGEAQKSYNWTLNADGSGDRPKSVFDDDFTPASLGSAWTFIDSTHDATGNPASYSLNGGGSLSIKARGSDVWEDNTKSVNQFGAVYRSDITGNFDVTVKVASQTDTDPWAHSGILVFNNFANTGSGGAFTVTVTPGHGFAVHFDTAMTVGRFDSPVGGVGTAVYPCWLRAVRSGTTFAGYYKTDINAAWTLIMRTGTSQNTGTNSQIGLYVCSHNTSSTCTAVFDNFRGGGNISGAFDLSFAGTSATAGQNANLAAALSAGNVDFTGYAGAFSFLANTLTASGNVNFGSTVTLNPGTGTLNLSGTGTQTLTPKSGASLPALVKSGSGTAVLGGSLSAAAVSLSAGTLDLGNRTSDLSAFTATGGQLRGLGAGDSLIVDGDADFSGLASFPAAGNIVVRAMGDGKQAHFTPGLAQYPNLSLWAYPTAQAPPRVIVGAGSVNVVGALNLVDQKMTGLSTGVIDFQANNANVTVGGAVTRLDNGSGSANSQSLLMGNGTWTVSGNVSLSMANGGSAGTSTLDMKAGAGMQSLSVSGGSLAAVVHDGAGTLQLAAPLAAASLTQSAGTLDFNGQGVNLSGNMQVTNGTSTSIAGLAGVTLTVNGSTSFLGSAGNLLDLNPASGWTVSSGGPLTADYATIAKSSATASQGNATLNCVDGGGNSQWNFAQPTNPAVLTRRPANVTALVAGSATFTVHATGSGTLAYAWRKAGVPDTLSRDTLLTLNGLALGDNGSAYICFVSNAFGRDSGTATLTVNQSAAVTRQPKDTTVIAGNKAVFRISAQGTSPLTYAWYRKGNANPIGSDTVLTISSPAAADNGARFYCVVANGFSTATSDTATLTVNVPATVTREPADDTVIAGHKASFSLAAVGTGTLNYVWRKLGDTTKLGTDTIYTRDSVAFADSNAQFYAVVANAYGADTSRAARLIVVRPAKIALQPKDLTVGPGKRANFSASATGTGAISFQWFRKGSATVISHDSTYALDSAKVSDDGAVFFVVASNAYGSDTSRGAVLSVATCDSVFTVARDTFTVDEGQSVTISGKALCSDGYQWSVVSGPAPRLLDPEVQDLVVVAPRVNGDTAIVYRFTAQFGAAVNTHDVTVRVREAIPDPQFTLPAPAQWNGAASLTVHAPLTNAAALSASAYHPPVIYSWTLSDNLADTTFAGDSLTLSHPRGAGLLDVGLCLSNGGPANCLHTTVQISPLVVALFRAVALNVGPVSLLGRELLWNVPASARIWDWSGRILWKGHGSAGELTIIPADAERALRGHRARLDVSP